VSDERIKSLSVTCQCGKVEFEVVGAPILAASCHCTSCRRAGRAFEALPWWALGRSVAFPDRLDVISLFC
jgi:hypothetical protein